VKVALAPPADFGDARNIHNRRSVHTRELLLVEARLHRGHGMTHEVVSSLDVNPHVVTVGAEPIDVALIEEEYATAVAQNDSPGVRIGQDSR
jgi:hypothetical protein